MALYFCLPEVLQFRESFANEVGRSPCFFQKTVLIGLRASLKGDRDDMPKLTYLNMAQIGISGFSQQRRAAFFGMNNMTNSNKRGRGKGVVVLSHKERIRCDAYLCQATHPRSNETRSDLLKNHEKFSSLNSVNIQKSLHRRPMSSPFLSREREGLNRHGLLFSFSVRDIRLRKPLDSTFIRSVGKQSVPEAAIPVYKEKKYYTSYSKLSEVKLLTIGIASPLRILQWAEKTLSNGKIYGEVLNANTLHHKTFKPQKGGLFCERIFGPLKDFECACGKTDKSVKFESGHMVSSNFQGTPSDSKQRSNESKSVGNRDKQEKNVNLMNTSGQIKPNRKYCPECDVEYTWSVIRRYQLGYIKLNSPVTHIWFLKGTPSYLSILLDIKKRYLQYVTYCSETLTIENSLNNKGAILDSPSKIFESWQNIVNKKTVVSPMPLEKVSRDPVSRAPKEGTTWSMSLEREDGVFSSLEETSVSSLEETSAGISRRASQQQPTSLFNRNMVSEPGVDLGTPSSNLEKRQKKRELIRKLNPASMSLSEKWKDILCLPTETSHISVREMASLLSFSFLHKENKAYEGILRPDSVPGSSVEERREPAFPTTGFPKVEHEAREQKENKEKLTKKGTLLVLALNASVYYNSLNLANHNVLDFDTFKKEKSFGFSQNGGSSLHVPRHPSLSRADVGAHEEIREPHYFKTQNVYTSVLMEIQRKLPVDLYILSSLERMLHRKSLILSINNTWQKLYKQAYVKALNKVRTNKFMPFLFLLTDKQKSDGTVVHTKKRSTDLLLREENADLLFNSIFSHFEKEGSLSVNNKWKLSLFNNKKWSALFSSLFLSTKFEKEKHIPVSTLLPYLASVESLGSPEREEGSLEEERGDSMSSPLDLPLEREGVSGLLTEQQFSLQKDSFLSIKDKEFRMGSLRTQENQNFIFQIFKKYYSHHVLTSLQKLKHPILSLNYTTTSKLSFSNMKKGLSSGSLDDHLQRDIRFEGGSLKRHPLFSVSKGVSGRKRTAGSLLTSISVSSELENYLILNTYFIQNVLTKSLLRSLVLGKYLHMISSCNNVFKRLSFKRHGRPAVLPLPPPERASSIVENPSILLPKMSSRSLGISPSLSREREGDSLEEREPILALNLYKDLWEFKTITCSSNVSVNLGLSSLLLRDILKRHPSRGGSLEREHLDASVQETQETRQMRETQQKESPPIADMPEICLKANVFGHDYGASEKNKTLSSFSNLISALAQRASRRAFVEETPLSTEDGRYGGLLKERRLSVGKHGMSLDGHLFFQKSERLGGSRDSMWCPLSREPLSVAEGKSAQGNIGERKNVVVLNTGSLGISKKRHPSDSKSKKIYNNVYTLSHRERWQADKDWQIFNGFNMSLSEYTDFPISTYKNRLLRDSMGSLDSYVFPSFTSESMLNRTADLSGLQQKAALPQETPSRKRGGIPLLFPEGESPLKEKSPNRFASLPTESVESVHLLNGGLPETRSDSTITEGRQQKERESPRHGALSVLREIPGIVLDYKLSSAFYSGAGMVQQLLNEFDFHEIKKLDKQNRLLLYELNKHILKLKKQVQIFVYDKTAQVQLKELCKKRDLLIRRTKLVRKLFRKESDPASMILTVLPVLPPDLRPIVKMAGQIAASDLNRLYQRVIYRNDRLKKFLKDPATSQSYEMKYAQRLLQEAVDNLLQNGKSGLNSEKDARGRALKSLSDMLKGKQGRFRQFLLGKRVDYSGRSVIVVGPKLKLHECGLPLEMAKELYLPFLLKTILNKNYAKTVIGAKTLIKNHPSLAQELLREIMQVSPVLLNRAPTLHRLGIQAFIPKLIEGRAILLHPLACSAFNADFDGDQMAVHVPITIEARAEAWKLMLSPNNILSPATGDPLAIPSQDMVLGCYYLTTFANNPKILKGSGMYFQNLQDVLKAYHLQKIDLHAFVWVKWADHIENGNDQEEPIEIRLSNNGHWQEISSNYDRIYDSNHKLVTQYMVTTPGRILFNSIIQQIMTK